MENEEKIVSSGNLQIWAERFGASADPAIVLIMGTSAQAVMWPDELVLELVNNGFQVVRFDNRDTGRSDCVNFETDPYTVPDMAADCLAVLDGFDIAAAHVVGISLGGTIAQWLAVHRPTRVRSLVAIASSPLGHDPYPARERALAGQEPDPDDLPGSDPRFLHHIAERAANPPVTREDQISSSVETWRVLNGEVSPFDQDAARAFVLESERRAHTPEAADNHGLIGLEGQEGALSSITVPTLVIHGTEDSIFPPEHGRALAEQVPNARIEIIHGMGHHFFSPELPTYIAELIVDHLEK